MEFKIFRDEMRSHLNKMIEESQAECLYQTGIDKDEIWDVYLNSFPEENGVRQSYNCNHCKSFLRQWGGLVVINKNDNTVTSLWDFIPSDPLFVPVAKNLSEYVKSKPVSDVFVGSGSVGVEKNRCTLPSGEVIYWNHFNISIPSSVSIRVRVSEDSTMAVYRSKKDVFKRSLEEISKESLDIVLELIDQGSIYKGEENKQLLKSFRNCLIEYSKIPDKYKDNYTWRVSRSLSEPIAKIKNTSIGQLLTDISEGKDLDSAVISYERMVAPENYKRPKAIATKRMIEDAQKTIESLGLMDSLPRRHATLDDITVGNVLFVDRNTKKKMTSNVFDEIKEDTPVNPRSLKKVDEVNINDFINNILPNSKGLEILVENRHVSNFMTLTAPVNKESKSLFKWDNGFSWSYNGDVTDSIKQKVKNAGGNTDAVLRCSLHWFNYDDLDIHVIEPNGNEIYFSKKENISTSGKLDVDMNAGSGKSRDAVENITWTNSNRMLEGRYKLVINNFCKREHIDEGFECEIECNGELHKFEYGNSVRNGENVTVAEFEWTRNGGIKIIKSLKDTGSMVSNTEWNINTSKFQKVSMVMLSPNYWDENKVGNKHYFFIIEGCKNPNPVRGFYNEYLNSELDKHKRVFEILGNKMKSEYSDSQLSGLGFSSTKRDYFYCKVKGSFDRTIKVTI